MKDICLTLNIAIKMLNKILTIYIFQKSIEDICLTL